ncbi:MAG: glutaminyl-peptide cyclotransferase [Symploca sp. SIO2E6]|nr:glutaminyl-peptide cyclotransferase [Symploca sp. SIO2E6]
MTNDKQQTTNDKQQTTNDKQQTTNNKRQIFIALVVTISLAIGIFWFYGQKAGTSVSSKQQPQASVYGYRVVNTYPHDREAFTQGLIYHDGVLYEGTGLRGRSSLRRVELATGKVLQIHPLDKRYFGEGITLWQNRIMQLTWTSGTGFVYHPETFEKLGEFTHRTQGWGLTHDNQRLIMSDGTDTLYFMNPDTFEEIGSIQVQYQDQPVTNLNELEYINGEIFANVWQTDFIVRISPQTGRVLSVIDLTGLLETQSKTFPYGSEDVLNGIAYDEPGDRLFVTGKLWPKLFEIELVELGIGN